MRSTLLLWLLAAPPAILHAQSGAWVTLAPMPDPRQEVASAELNGRIYVVGGLPRTSRVQEYDPANDTWRFVAPLPVQVDHAAAVSLNGRLYVMGGTTNQGISGGLYEYDPSTDAWTSRASMPTPRSALAAAVIGGRIYAVGGSGSSQRELETYDPGTNTWASLPPMPTGRNHLAAGAIGGRLYVAGGRPGNLAVLEAFDPATGTWSSLKPMTTGRSGHAAAVVDGRLYTFGGEGNPASPIGIFGEAEVYDPATDSWQSLDPMPVPRHGIGAAALGKRIYIPGGATQQGGGTQTGVNETFVVQSEKIYFAHFASGAGISTETVLGNLSGSAPSLVTVTLRDQQGGLEGGLQGGVSRITAEIAPHGSVTIRGADPSGSTRVGWMEVSAEQPPSGTILFSSSIQGFLGLAGVGSGVPTRRFFVPVQRDPFIPVTNGIAIANITGSPVSVTLTLRTAGGGFFVDRTLQIPARGQISMFLSELFPNADIATVAFRGTVTAVSTGNVVAVALLFTGTEFATLPVSPY